MNYERVYAEIDLDALKNNVNTIQSLLPPSTNIMGIIKADAYGHGAVECAKTILFNGVTSLGVAMIDEAIQLRENLITAPILILGATHEHLMYNLIKYDIQQTVYSIPQAEQLNAIARSVNKSLDIHIKLDTGMNRLGFLIDDKTINNIQYINNMSNLNIVGIYTHLADADNDDFTFTIEQYNKFVSTCKQLEQLNINIPIKHISNSPAILRHKFDYINTVRAGLILYGLNPIDNAYNLQPVMSLKTTITHIKCINANDTVGYSRTYRATKPTVIATIPIGYADGYSRMLSNRGFVIINDTIAPIVGNVCMDQLMVDITGIDTHCDDEVILIGASDNCTITADTLANLCNTISYEIVCNVGKRVPRIYKKNNKQFKTVQFMQV